MSFSNSVREEIASTITDKDKKYAVLYGMLLFTKKVSSDKIVYQTESEISSDTFKKLVFEVFDGDVICDITERSQGSQLYTMLIEDTYTIERIRASYRMNSAPLLNTNIIDNNNVGLFLAGVFLSCGSITDPNKEYHLEFVCYNEEISTQLLTLIKSFGLNCNMIQRKNSFVVYIKGSENIEDLLTFMGAGMCSLELMNVKILKDVRNKANRIANCDSANIERIVKASGKQIEDISFIDSKIGLYNLPYDLREIAFARAENPELSLKELGEILEKPLGRSGVNHRLNRIKEIAEGLRKQDV